MIKFIANYYFGIVFSSCYGQVTRWRENCTKRERERERERERQKQRREVLRERTLIGIRMKRNRDKIVGREGKMRERQRGEREGKSIRKKEEKRKDDREKEEKEKDGREKEEKERDDREKDEKERDDREKEEKEER